MLEISSPNDPSPKMKPSISDRPPIVMLSSKNGNMLITAMNGHMKEAKKVEQSRMARRKMRVSSARILISELQSKSLYSDNPKSASSPSDRSLIIL